MDIYFIIMYFNNLNINNKDDLKQYINNLKENMKIIQIGGNKIRNNYINNYINYYNYKYNNFNKNKKIIYN